MDTGVHRFRDGACRLLCLGPPAGRVLNVLVPLVLLAATAPMAARQDAPAYAAWSDQQKEEFLRTAEIVSRRTLPVGVTLSSRATLTDGVTTHDAHIQTVSDYQPRFKSRGRTLLNFHDSYKYNIAAYRLDRLLGLNMVPVSVERKVDGETAAVTWWVDNLLMSLREQYEERKLPPDIRSWNNQRYQGKAFNQLIYNTDANQGNYLIDADWRLWLIDFTRAFRTLHKLYNRKELKRIDRSFLESLEAMTPEQLEAATGRWLRRGERRAILARRDRLVDHFTARIEELGEAEVLCDLSRDREAVRP